MIHSIDSIDSIDSIHSFESEIVVACVSRACMLHCVYVTSSFGSWVGHVEMYLE